MARSLPEMTPDIMRLTRRQAVRRATIKVQRAEEALRAAIRARDECLIGNHGDRADGFLSYMELVHESGLSRSRIIQIVQPTRKAEAS